MASIFNSTKYGSYRIVIQNKKDVKHEVDKFSSNEFQMYKRLW
jgi:hypothetical protein